MFWKSPTLMFNCEFWEVFQNNFFGEHLRATASAEIWNCSFIFCFYLRIHEIANSTTRLEHADLGKSKFFSFSVLFWILLVKSRQGNTFKSAIQAANGYHWPFKRQPYKMVKHTQTTCRVTADKLFECVRPFSRLALKGLKSEVIARTLPTL